MQSEYVPCPGRLRVLQGIRAKGRGTKQSGCNRAQASGTNSPAAGRG